MTGAAKRELVCHPQSSSNLVRGVQVSLQRLSDGRLASRYVIEGAIDRLRIPPPAVPVRADGLWRHTCFEIFVSDRMPAYREFNFSPSGQWSAYAFAAYRQAAEAPAAEPSVSVRVATDRLELDASIPVLETSRLSVALSAVIEDTSGELSYWALKHPPGKPDFHHPDSFVLEL